MNPPHNEPLPSKIGPYDVCGRIGRGGMGVVLRGELSTTKDPVALKTIRVPSERHLAAIRREIRALAQVDHPGVVRIVDEGLQDGLPWYAMELLEGGTLRDHRFSAPVGPDREAATASAPVHVDGTAPTVIGARASGPVDAAGLPALLDVFRRLCDPLGFVHGEGLVHCDLKPENVFLCEDGRLVLVDFGLISRFGGAVNREELDLELFVGTAEYMAPEQWEGKPVDARTDLYALGCMLYECITGQAPYSGPRKEMYREHIKTPVPKLRSLAPDAPKALEALVCALLAKSPGLRPGHADEVARALEALGATAPTPGPEPRPYLFRPGISGRGRITHDVVQRVASPSASGQVVLLGGESGVGKTRLAMEAARMARRAQMRVLTSECAPKGRVLEPVRRLLTAVVDRAHAHPEEAYRLLAPHGRVLARLEPALLHLELVAAQPEPDTLPAEAERLRLLEALLETTEAFAEQQRFFWLLDDLHWADRLTIDFLGLLIGRQGADGPISLLGTFRSEEVSPELEALLRRDGVERLDLGRLPPRAVARMIADMLGMEPPEGFVQFLAAQSEGNPFFVAEYLRAAVGSGLLARAPGGHWRLEGAEHPEQLGLPGSLVALLAHRLDHLSPRARTLADAASVFGRELDPDRAQRIAGLEGAQADLAFDELARKQILEETGSGLVRFSHDKIREVAYDRLEVGARQDLHRSAARELERARKQGATDVFAAALAHHWLEAGEPAKAVVHLDRAAEDALASGGYQQATLHLERALELSAPKADGGHNVALAPMKRASWHQRLGETHLAAGQLDASARHAEAALDLLDVPRPHSRFGWTRTLLGQFLRQLAHRVLPEGAFVVDEGADTLAEATRATAHIARVAFFENDPLRLIAASVWSINLAERAGSFMHAARNYSGLGWTFGLGRMHRIADAYFARARRVGEQSRDWAGLIFALTGEALYRIGRGEFEAVRAALAACEEPCARAQDPQGREVVDTLACHPFYFLGDFVEAIERHEAVLRSARARENHQHVAWSLYCIGRAHIALGAYGPAVEHLEEAARTLEALTDHMSAITCTGLRTTAALRSGDIASARQLAEETDRLIGNTLPTAFITLHGYEGVAEVALFDLLQAPSPAHRKRAARAVRRLVKTASVFPVGQARAHLLQARFQRLVGRDKAAAKSLEAGKRWASRFGLRYEEACLIEETGRMFDARSARRTVNDKLAGRIFDALGCAGPEGAYLDAER